MEEKNNFFDVDDLIYFLLCCAVFLVLVLFSIYQFNKSNHDLEKSEEKECVIFYKENSYVLESCDEYKAKLLKLDMKVDDSEE